MSNYDIEKTLFKKGFINICGIDEAGRGPFAGPVCAAAVILEIDCEILDLDDSKKIKSEIKRERIFDDITKKAIDFSISMIDNQEIDDTGILNATFKAMRNAVLGLETKPDYLLIDGNLYRNFDDFEGTFVVKGDSKSMSISAASILAKVTRDRYMNDASVKYPDYNFEKHKGYGTKSHREKLVEIGHCEIHRKTFLRKLYEKHNCNW